MTADTTLMDYCEMHVAEPNNWQGPHCCECLRRTLAVSQQEAATAKAREGRLRAVLSRAEEVILSRLVLRPEPLGPDFGASVVAEEIRSVLTTTLA